MTVPGRNSPPRSERRTRVVQDEGINPRKAGLAFALALHMDQLVQRSLLMLVPFDTVPLDTDPIGFIESIPTVHVLGGLLAGQYRNSRCGSRPTGQTCERYVRPSSDPFEELAGSVNSALG
jgi:hypothetical protein